MYSQNPGYLHAPSATLGVKRMGPQNWSKSNYTANAPLRLHGYTHGLRGGELNGVAYGAWGAESGGGMGSYAKWAGAGLVFGVIAYIGYSKLR